MAVKSNFSRLSAVQVANLMGVDARTVSRWCGEGVPRNKDKTFDGPAVIKWRLARAMARGEADQRQRLAAAQAERVEMDNAKRRGELIERSEALAVWTHIISDCRAQLLALPHKVAPRLANQSVEKVFATLRAEVHQTLNDLAESGGDDGLSNLNNR